MFAVGGCEKISPYVNKVENPSKGFPRGMIALAVMVVTCAILGTLAMSRMFDPAVINASAESFNAYVANSSYWAFQKLGQYYHVGDLFMIIYALCNVISQLAVLILSIDAPLRMLLDNEHTKQFIPQLCTRSTPTVCTATASRWWLCCPAPSFWHSPSCPVLLPFCAS